MDSHELFSSKKKKINKSFVAFDFTSVSTKLESIAMWHLLVFINFSNTFARRKMQNSKGFRLKLILFKKINFVAHFQEKEFRREKRRIFNHIIDVRLLIIIIIISGSKHWIDKNFACSILNFCCYCTESVMIAMMHTLTVQFNCNQFYKIFANSIS